MYLLGTVYNINSTDYLVHAQKQLVEENRPSELSLDKCLRKNRCMLFT